MGSVLTIAGSDPSGGAGIEADLAAFAVLGVRGRTAITALTVQNYGCHPERHFCHPEAQPKDLACEILRCAQNDKPSAQNDKHPLQDDSLHIHPTSPDVLANILNSQQRDTLPDAVKIGMIGTLANLEVICDFLGRHSQIPVVLDPVLRATSGLLLLEVDAIPMLKEKLWPLATVVTPNLDEVGILLGHRPTTVAEMESAARELQRGTQVIVVKGGHLDGDPVDVVWDGEEMRHLSSPRIDTPHLRGTGCRLASAIAAYMALGKDPRVAIQSAREWLLTRYRISNAIYGV